MQSYDKDSKVQFAIERRLEETRVSGGVRPWMPPVRPRVVARTGMGPMLVKIGAHAGGPSSSETFEMHGGAAPFDAGGERLGQSMGRLLRMRAGIPEPSEDRSDERMLGVLAGLGPLLWVGHAVLVWLNLA